MRSLTRYSRRQRHHEEDSEDSGSDVISALSSDEETCDSDASGRSNPTTGVARSTNRTKSNKINKNNGDESLTTAIKDLKLDKSDKDYGYRGRGVKRGGFRGRGRGRGKRGGKFPSSRSDTQSPVPMTEERAVTPSTLTSE
ncbi:hypothetical protein K7432_017847, partial [Basidiobolus ranarum]